MTYATYAITYTDNNGNDRSVDINDEDIAIAMYKGVRAHHEWKAGEDQPALWRIVNPDGDGIGVAYRLSNYGDCVWIESTAKLFGIDRVKRLEKELDIKLGGITPRAI